MMLGESLEKDGHVRVGGERDTGGESGEGGARRQRDRRKRDGCTERGELPSGKVRMCQLVG